MTAVTDDKIERAVMAVREQLIEAREKKATGRATVSIDLHQGGITKTEVGLVRIAK